MKAKEFIPQSKPRNFVAKNQKTAGAGAHKDKKKAEKQGDVKHKGKQFEEGVAEGLFGIDDKIKGKIQNIVSDLSDIPGMWDHKGQTFTPKGLEKLKSVLKNNPKYIKYALNLDYRDYEAEGVAEGYPKHQDLSGISTEKLKAYLAKQTKQSVPGEGSQVRRVQAELQRRSQGVAEGDVMEYETHRYTDDQGNEWEVNDEGDKTLIRAAPGSSYGRSSSRYNRLPRNKYFDMPSQQKKGMYFYNVNDPQTAQKLGLKQSKSGKWYLPAGSLQKDTADKVFGAGKYWEPKS